LRAAGRIEDLSRGHSGNRERVRPKVAGPMTKPAVIRNP
jgi:hypothetical protein